MFEIFDKDKSGSTPPPRSLLSGSRNVYAPLTRTAAISVSELSKIFATLKMDVTEAQAAAILKKVDKDADNQLNFEEFLQVMSHQPKKAQSEAYLLAAFKQYDANGDGYITRQELREAMAKTGEILSEKDLIECVSLISCFCVNVLGA